MRARHVHVRKLEKQKLYSQIVLKSFKCKTEGDALTCNTQLRQTLMFKNFTLPCTPVIENINVRSNNTPNF